MERDRFFVLTRDLLCLATFDGYFIRLNPAWSLTLGYTLEEMMEHPFIDFVHPDDRERTIAETSGLRKGNETVFFENRYRCKDGSYRWLSWSARPIVADRIIFASARDLTERKRTEEEMVNLNHELKQRAEQLEMANKELEAFSYSVSHDLRSPLRHIHGFVELLQKSPALQAEESSVRYMTVIARAARDMGMLIDDLLAFSRTGRAEMHPRPINVRDLIDQVIGEMEPDNRNRRITWDIRNLPRARGDAGLLRLVWTNLISNALKYSRPREETRIEIGVLGVADPAVRPNETVFYIRDNGVGFDMKYATKLFGVFQRLHRAEQFEGTGIGLANVQRIIMRHGGRVWAESQPDAGATFYFSLPNTPVPEITHVQDQAHPVGGR
jgi:PAS domain S-box-containing protein